MTLQIEDDKRVRTLTLNRPEALNAFNEALYDATAEAVLAAAEDPEVAVVLLTGTGRGFSAGTDLGEMQARIADPNFTPGKHGFIGLINALSAFPKPFICAVNGVGVGIGATILGYADLTFMSSTARLKCPFTSLGVAPEAASSYLLPQLMGPAERRLAVDVIRMGRRRRGVADGPGLARLRTGRAAAAGPSPRRNPCLPADFELDGRQAHDDGTGSPRDRGGHRAGKRALREAHGRASQRGGAG